MNTDIDIDNIIKHLYIDIIGDLKVWRRNSEDLYSSSQYMKILIESIKHITGDNCFENRHKFEYTNKYFDDNNELTTCICSCDKCRKLYIIYHKESNEYFAVGSSCVKKFKPKGYENMGRSSCIICNNALWYKTTKNNTKNAVKGNELCFDCIENKGMYINWKK